MKTVDVIAAALVIVGALNWGLAGTVHLDLVAAIFGMRFGETSALSSIVYGLVGLAGLYQALTWKSIQRRLTSIRRSRDAGVHGQASPLAIECARRKVSYS